MAEQSVAAMEQQLQAQFAQRLVGLPDGGQVAWREAGDATSDFAVVLLHGISSGAGAQGARAGLGCAGLWRLHADGHRRVA